MKKMMIYLLLSLLLSCNKEPLPEPPIIPPATKLQVSWQKPITTDTSESWVILQGANNNKVLYSRILPDPRFVQARNAEDGKLEWIFDGFVSPGSGLYDIYSYENNVLVQDGQNTYCVDYATGQRNWYTEGIQSITKVNQIGEFAYTVHTTKVESKTVSSSLVRTRTQNIFSGWDTLYTRLAVPDTFPIFNIPVLWINNEADSILIFNDVHSYNGPPPTAGRSKTYLTALNLRTREVIWQYPDFKGYYIAPPLVDGDRLYINGPDAFCFDLNTGQLLWQKAFEGGVGGTSLVVHNDILVVQSTQIGMWGLNKYTGDQIWYNKDTDGTTWELVLFDGIVYCTSSGYGRLYAVNAETGITIWKGFSPNASHPKTRNASFADARVAIDPERRLLYTADGFYIMCIKLPEK